MHVIPFKLLILQTQNMCKSKAQDENRFPCSCSRSLCSWNWLNFFCRHCRRWIADVSAPLWANVQNDLLTVHIVCISRCFFSFSPFHNNKCDPIFVNKRIVRSHMWAHMIINSTHSTQRACVRVWRRSGPKLSIFKLHIYYSLDGYTGIHKHIRIFDYQWNEKGKKCGETIEKKQNENIIMIENSLNCHLMGQKIHSFSRFTKTVIQCHDTEIPRDSSVYSVVLCLIS